MEGMSSLAKGTTGFHGLPDSIVELIAGNVETAWLLSVKNGCPSVISNSMGTLNELSLWSARVGANRAGKLPETQPSIAARTTSPMQKKEYDGQALATFSFLFKLRLHCRKDCLPSIVTAISGTMPNLKSLHISICKADTARDKATPLYFPASLGHVVLLEDVHVEG
jgi:hypothetical protein